MSTLGSQTILLALLASAVAGTGFGDRQGAGSLLIDSHPLYALTEGVPQAALIVKDTLKVCTWPVKRWSGQREWDIIDEGITAHPNVELVTDPAEADFILFVTVQDVDREKELIRDAEIGWNSETWGKHINKKMVVIDYADTADDHGGIRELTDIRSGPSEVPYPIAVFKRSWLHKHNGSFWLTQEHGENSMAKGHEYTKSALRYWRHRWNQWFPIAYSVLDRSVAPYEATGRKTHVVCTLRETGHGQVHIVNMVRRRVMGWLREAKAEWGDITFSLGAPSKGRAAGKADGYVQAMKTAHIVVTADPSYYEGDHRLWEAFGSGAMVMTNTMWAPIPFKAVDNKHIVYYDAYDKAAFLQTLRYYVDHTEEAAVIGRAGFDHAMTYHRSASRVDYILSTATRARDANVGLSQEYKYGADDQPMDLLRNLAPVHMTEAEAQEVGDLMNEWHTVDCVNKIREMYASGYLWDALADHVPLSEEALAEIIRLAYLPAE